MNVQELRDALHDRADHVADIGAPARIAATHERVVVVRRRRRAGVVAAVATAVIAVVTAGALSLLPDRPQVQPAEHHTPAKLAGYRVDPRVSFSGWDFRYAQGVQSARGQQQLVLDLPSSKEQRIFGWGVRASGFSDRTATLRLDGVVVDHTGPATWTSGDVLSAGRPHHLVVSFRKHSPGNRAGVAVYDLAGTAPAGVTNGATTFRSTIAGDTLVGAHLGRSGQSRVAFEVTVPSTRLRFSTSCAGAPTHDMVELSVNGQPLGSSSCDPLPDLDPGASGASRGPQGWDGSLGIHPGATLHLTLRLLGRHDRPTTVPGVVLGGGVYRLAAPVARVAGWDVPALVEGPGGTYRYQRSAQSRPGQARLTLHLAAASQRRLVNYGTSHVRGEVDVVIDGRSDDGVQGGGSSYAGGPVLSPGRPHTVTLVVRRGLTPRSVLGIVISRRQG
ncbi:MAG TPA: hypothetical protein VI452_17725 [Marmoricola sp.]